MDQPRAERLDPASVDQDLLAEWVRISASVQAAESGETASLVVRSSDQLRTLLPARAHPLWAGWLGDRLVGTAQTHAAEHPDAAFIRLYVDQRHRRHGVGRAMAAAVAADRHEAGFTTLYALVRVGSDADRFVTARGATVADALVVDALHHADADEARLAELATPPAGYALRSWCGRAPDDLIDSYAAAKQAIADAPNEDPPAIPDWDHDLIRERELAFVRQGRPLWVTVALDDAGRVAAFTEIGVPDPAPGLRSTMVDASQEDTVVLAEHRRRGLATCVKAELIGRLLAQRPDVASIASTTALTNQAMRRVNKRLGFGEVFRRNLIHLPATALF